MVAGKWCSIKARHRSRLTKLNSRRLRVDASRSVPSRNFLCSDSITDRGGWQGVPGQEFLKPLLLRGRQHNRNTATGFGQDRAQLGWNPLLHFVVRRFLAVEFTVLLLGALTAWHWHHTH